MTIKLNLVYSLILEAVKAETHIKGQVDRAVDDKAAKVAYQEEAGDEAFHERKLARGIYTAVDNLKGELAQYVYERGATTANNIVATIDSGTADSISIVLSVSDSFNKSFTDSLARLCSKYIEDTVLVLWWGTFNANQAQYYTSLLASDTLAIGKCFIRNAPAKVDIPYTSAITLTATTVDLTVGEETSVTYTIDSGAIDDVELFVPWGVIWKRDATDGVFLIKALYAGVFRCKLYSVHDEDVTATLTIRATEE